jgi:hypothetical protein
MRFLHDDLDREIVDQIVPRQGKGPKRTIVFGNSSKSTKKSKTSAVAKAKAAYKKARSAKTQAAAAAAPTPRMPFFGSRASFYSKNMNMAMDDHMNYLDNEVDGAEKNIQYGFARQQQLQRSAQVGTLVESEPEQSTDG